VEAARAAGMRCVAVETTHAAGALGGADLRVPSLAALHVEVASTGSGGPTFRLAAMPASGAPA
jgi:beta-phosphoglucomutase-like phosphatase (HAD superfamily)